MKMDELTLGEKIYLDGKPCGVIVSSNIDYSNHQINGNEIGKIHFVSGRVPIYIDLKIAIFGDFCLLELKDSNSILVKSQEEAVLLMSGQLQKDVRVHLGSDDK